jgi:hypothetical protein
VTSLFPALFYQRARVGIGFVFILCRVFGAQRVTRA